MTTADPAATLRERLSVSDPNFGISGNERSAGRALVVRALSGEIRHTLKCMPTVVVHA
jgi:hypothetical protein